MKLRAMIVPREGPAHIMMIDAQPTPTGFGAPSFLNFLLDGQEIRFHFAGIKKHGVVYKEMI